MHGFPLYNYYLDNNRSNCLVWQTNIHDIGIYLATFTLNWPRGQFSLVLAMSVAVFVYMKFPSQCNLFQGLSLVNKGHMITSHAKKSHRVPKSDKKWQTVITLVNLQRCMWLSFEFWFFNKLCLVYFLEEQKIYI